MKREYKVSFKNQSPMMASLTVYRTGYQHCKSGYSRGEEIRSFYLIHYVLSGSGTFSLNGIIHPVKTGDAFLIYPHMPINYWADYQDPWEFCWVGYNGTDAHALVNATRFTPQNPVISIFDFDRMKKLMLSIYAARGSGIHQTTLMTAKLYELHSYLLEEAGRINLRSTRSGLDHVQLACDYIAENYHKAITIEEIAAHANVCRSWLYRMFMQHLSVSPKQYLMEYRMREACRLMRKETKLIKEIATAVGFQDPLFFSTAFKKVIGKSPRTYMKDNKDIPVELFITKE